MLDFDQDTFPFAIMSGLKSINLVNLKTRFMTELVQTKVWCSFGQSAMFLQRSQNGYVLNYVTIEKDQQNQFFSNWFALPLHDDFVNCLKTIGRPPPSSTVALIEELKSFEDLKKGDEELKKEDEELKKEILDMKKEIEELKKENEELKTKYKPYIKLSFFSKK